MTMICSTHLSDARFVPPGTSKKTGRPYQGFWSCTQMGCKGPFVENDAYPQPAPFAPTRDLNPIGALNSPKVEQSYHSERKDVPTQAYWQKQGRMKALCGMINAQLSFGVKPLDINVPQLTALVEEVEKEASEIISTEELKVESEGWQKLDSEPPF